MNYEIKGGNLPVVEIRLNAGERIISENGAMSWMTPTIQVETTTNAGGNNGGLGKLFGRAFTGESLFMNEFTAMADGLLAFSSSFAGEIVAVQITPDQPLVVQKRAFLAATSGVQLSVFFQKRLGTALIGGEGFIMEKLTGNGIAFLEIDGSLIQYDLGPGQQMIVDQGHLATMSETCSVDIIFQKGIKNLIFSGDGMTNTIVTGPGRIGLQTMPVQQVAGSLIPYLPQRSGN